MHPLHHLAFPFIPWSSITFPWYPLSSLIFLYLPFSALTFSCSLFLSRMARSYRTLRWYVRYRHGLLRHCGQWQYQKGIILSSSDSYCYHTSDSSHAMFSFPFLRSFLFFFTISSHAIYLCQLLHVAVSDVSDDVRRAAVTALG